MAKGYWIATISIRELDGYAAYQAAVRATLEKYGGRYLIRGGKSEIREGAPRPRAVSLPLRPRSSSWPSLARRRH